MTFSQFPKYPCDEEAIVAKRLLKGHFWQFARIQWHLVAVDIFILQMEMLFFVNVNCNLP